MDTEALKLFLHLAQSLHFGKTGQACHISPSALSRQIQRMESEVGQVLFERNNRMVRLTPAGALFKRYAQTALENWRLFLEEMAFDQGALQGEITIYCSITASLSVLPDLLSRFKTAYPQIKLKIETGDAAGAIQKVAQAEADIAVAALPHRLPKTLAFKSLTKVSLVFVAPKQEWEYSKALERGIPWGKVPMILTERGLARKRVDSWFKQKNVRPNIYAKVSGNEAILSMVGLGCGLGVVPRLAIENSALQDRVTVIDVRPRLAPYDVGICIQKRNLASRLIKLFWDVESLSEAV